MMKNGCFQFKNNIVSRIISTLYNKSSKRMNLMSIVPNEKVDKDKKNGKQIQI